MRTVLKRLMIAVLGATVVFGSIAACSTRGHGQWTEERATEMRTKIVARISDKLDLDAAQKTKLNALADEITAQRKALRGDGGSARSDFQSLIAADKFDRAKAQGLLDQKTLAVQAQGPKVLTALADFYDTLNPAQQQKVRERLEKGHGRGWRWGNQG